MNVNDLDKIELGGFATLVGILLASIWQFLRWRSGVVIVDAETLLEMQDLYIKERDELTKERKQSREDREYYASEFERMKSKADTERIKCAEQITGLEGRMASLEQNEAIYQEQLLKMEEEIERLKVENREYRKRLVEKQEELDRLIEQLAHLDDAKDG